MSFFDDLVAEWEENIRVTTAYNVETMFSPVNGKVSEIASSIGQSPENWNSDIFSMIKTLSDNLILPIAGIILTFVMCYELIQMVIDKNNGHNFETFTFFKWIFKTVISVLIVSNTFPIIMGVFDVAQTLVSSSSDLITNHVDLGFANADLMDQLNAMDFGQLIGFWLETMILQLGMEILSLVIFLVINGRMLEIYLTVSVGSIPLATLGNNEMGQTGKNYLKTIFALAFQGFLIIVCVAIYSVITQSVVMGGDARSSIWSALGFTVLLCFMLFKTGSLSKSIFGAH